MRAGEHEVVVVGGGPAGAGAAALLAPSGCRTLLIEKEAAARHKICGEFLSVEAQACLRALGVDARALGGIPVGQVRLVHGRSVAEARLPFEGVSLTRKVLDEALLRRAAEQGARIRRGIAVREIAPAGSGLALTLSGGEEVRASTLFLATGKHDVRGAKRPSVAGSNELIGFKRYFRLCRAQARALDGTTEVILFGGGYAGLQLVEGGMANLCLLARRRLFERLGRTWEALLAHLLDTAPHLGDRLAGADAVLERPLAIYRVPYGFVHDAGAAQANGLFRLGDQVGVIPSFAGDGMAIALHTGRLAAMTYIERGDAASAFHRQVREDIEGPIRLASMLQRASEAPLGRSALLVLCRTFPTIIREIATRTRLPEQALRRTGLSRGR
ncbi:MAG TPA: FAD-dependent oxidoreductase [Microvirga sp.]|nr:FAD-dependent oxidoreductase [Microvirga sp.]